MEIDMVKKHFSESRGEYPVEGVKLYWLVDENDGAENFATRLFEVDPDTATPFHTHSWEHEVYIFEGKGVVRLEEGDVTFGAGDAIFIKPFEKHQFRNTSAQTLKFICVVPVERNS
jgi:quercetin dioxygenase-like cupin family protein